MILRPRMVVIPPDTRSAVFIDASGIWESVIGRIVENLGHERPRVIKHGGDLNLSQKDNLKADKVAPYAGIGRLEPLYHGRELLVIDSQISRRMFNCPVALLDEHGCPVYRGNIDKEEFAAPGAVDVLCEVFKSTDQLRNKC